MGKASRRKKRDQVPAAPAPSSAGYTLSPFKLFVGSLLLLGAGFTAGVLVQAGMGNRRVSSPSPVVSSPAPKAPLKMPSFGELQRIDQLKAHLEHTPEDVLTRVELGHALFDMGSYREAITHYQLVLEQQPRNADIRTDMGIAYRRTGRPDLAARAFRRAIQDDPQHVNAHYNLGVVLAHDLDDPAGAVAAWERFLELAPNSPNQGEVREAIQGLKTRLSP